VTQKIKKLKIKSNTTHSANPFEYREYPWDREP